MIGFLLALLPVVAIFLLLVLKKTPADVAGLFGWAASMLVAWLFFKTPLANLLGISLAGVVASFPITLMVGTSIFMISVMAETGAMSRIVALVKTLSPKDQVVQIMIINIGFGTVLAALGATPVSILPPIMLALGYSTIVSIAIPAIGYDALCTYALLAAPVVVFGAFVGKEINEVGIVFARFMPVISTCIGLGMLWIVGKWKMVLKGFVPTALAGLTAGFTAMGMNSIGLIPLTGVAAGLAVIVVMVVYLLVTRQPIMDRSKIGDADLAAEKKMGLLPALSPWLILVVFAVLTNVPFLPFLEWTTKGLPMAVTIIPGAPVKTAVLSQAYFWLLVATVLALPFMKASGANVQAALKKWGKRAPRPMIASALFFAIAYIYNHSGKDAAWQLVDPMNNMVNVIAVAASNALGRAYVAIAPFLGLFGGFIAGSEASSIAMFTKLHLSIGQKLGFAGVVVAAASGIGGGIASVISPAKLQNAAASIDKIGEETKVIPIAFVISIVITAICSALLLLWA